MFQPIATIILHNIKGDPIHKGEMVFSAAEDVAVIHFKEGMYVKAIRLGTTFHFYEGKAEAHIPAQWGVALN